MTTPRKQEGEVLAQEVFVCPISLLEAPKPGKSESEIIREAVREHIGRAMSESMAASIAGTVIGAAIGAMVTWLVARAYYVRASRDLEKAAADLRRLTAKVLVGLEEAGLVQLVRNESGEITGIVRSGKVDIRIG
jgi:hypothetical protein